jgi:hypothetical protein
MLRILGTLGALRSLDTLVDTGDAGYNTLSIPGSLETEDALGYRRRLA